MRRWKRSLWFVPPASVLECSELTALQATFSREGPSFATSLLQLETQASARLEESATLTGFALLRYSVLDPSGGSFNQTFAIIVTQVRGVSPIPRIACDRTL